MKGKNYLHYKSKSKIVSDYKLNYQDRKSGKHNLQHRKPLDRGFDLIRSHQQCIPSSPLLEKSTVLVRFSDHGNSIYNRIPLFKNKNICLVSNFSLFPPS